MYIFGYFDYFRFGVYVVNRFTIKFNRWNPFQIALWGAICLVHHFFCFLCKVQFAYCIRIGLEAMRGYKKQYILNAFPLSTYIGIMIIA